MWQARTLIITRANADCRRRKRATRSCTNARRPLGAPIGDFGPRLDYFRFLRSMALSASRLLRGARTASCCCTNAITHSGLA
ncbi:hypothetical protein SCOR_06995 [Sulfidibacter corallicola]